ncbi:MAG: hypothetical protein WDW38_010700 [Sanguina aurantia]
MFTEYVQSWKRHNPTWEYKLWTDEDNRALVATHYPEFLQAYDGFKHGIMRADFVRYLYMHHHGGLYADLDMECLKPMDTLMSTHMVVLARMGTNDSFSHSVPNAFMASVPGHPFWKFCIATSLMRWMVQLTLQEGVWYGPESITGPVVLKDAVDVYQEFHRENAPARGRLTILPAGTIYPVDWKALLDAQAQIKLGLPLSEDAMWMEQCLQMNETLYNRASCQKAVTEHVPWAHAVTYWSHSWGDEKVPLKKM